VGAEPSGVRLEIRPAFEASARDRACAGEDRRCRRASAQRVIARSADWRIASAPVAVKGSRAARAGCAALDRGRRCVWERGQLLERRAVAMMMAAACGPIPSMLMRSFERTWGARAGIKPENLRTGWWSGVNSNSRYRSLGRPLRRVFSVAPPNFVRLRVCHSARESALADEQVQESRWLLPLAQECARGHWPTVGNLASPSSTPPKLSVAAIAGAGITTRDDGALVISGAFR
jgi:hypothetical protein